MNKKDHHKCHTQIFYTCITTFKIKILVYLALIVLFFNYTYIPFIKPFSVLIIQHKLMGSLDLIPGDVGHKAEDTMDGVPNHCRAQKNRDSQQFRDTSANKVFLWTGGGNLEYMDETC